MTMSLMSLKDLTKDLLPKDEVAKKSLRLLLSSPEFASLLDSLSKQGSSSFLSFFTWFVFNVVRLNPTKSLLALVPSFTSIAPHLPPTQLLASIANRSVLFFLFPPTYQHEVSSLSGPLLRVVVDSITRTRFWAS